MAKKNVVFPTYYFTIYRVHFMSKYSNDFKLKLVEFYLKENRGIRYVADYFNISSKESIYFLYFAPTYVALIYKKIFY